MTSTQSKVKVKLTEHLNLPQVAISAHFQVYLLCHFWIGLRGSFKLLCYRLQQGRQLSHHKTKTKSNAKNKHASLTKNTYNTESTQKKQTKVQSPAMTSGLETEWVNWVETEGMEKENR